MALQQELLRRFVSSRREVNLYSPDGLTPVLVWAAEHGHLELVQDMILRGANPRLPCLSYGINAYHAVRFVPRKIQTTEELQRREQITRILRGPRRLLALAADNILHRVAEHVGPCNGLTLGAHLHRLEIPLELRKQLCNHVPASLSETIVVGGQEMSEEPVMEEQLLDRQGLLTLFVDMDNKEW